MFIWVFAIRKVAKCVSIGEIRQMWINAGNPRRGPVHDLHVKCKSRFKYALRFIKNNENMLAYERRH